MKIFRIISQRLLSENKFSKYLLYAIGEIILVVIGILIALQVNNWNQSKILSKQGTVLIENLKTEFKVNLENLKEVKTKNNLLYNSTNFLTKLIGEEDSIIQKHNVDSLIYNAILITDFQPNQFVLSQIKSGDKLDIIKSVKIKILLYEWDKALNVKTEAFNMLNTYFMNALIPFLDQNTSIRNADYYGNFEWSTKTPLIYNKTKVFQMLEFDNKLENYI
ncbi:MAG: hypothetical protein HQ521_22225 [Bacteroidetes bacterium]|nr:hypothetical protein [Bacteroidota bacterium]